MRRGAALGQGAGGVKARRWHGGVRPKAGACARCPAVRGFVVLGEPADGHRRGVSGAAQRVRPQPRRSSGPPGPGEHGPAACSAHRGDLWGRHRRLWQGPRVGGRAAAPVRDAGRRGARTQRSAGQARSHSRGPGVRAGIGLEAGPGAPRRGRGCRVGPAGGGPGSSLCRHGRRLRQDRFLGEGRRIARAHGGCEAPLRPGGVQRGAERLRALQRLGGGPGPLGGRASGRGLRRDHHGPRGAGLRAGRPLGRCALALQQAARGHG
mmetsp:Transcript_52203/g.163958  ORF Transcript_52203/g.163958 Transcript_52203/m.163958 type:complete len:265 (+) Transcript_52203:602-1396(+)